MYAGAGFVQAKIVKKKAIEWFCKTKISAISESGGIMINSFSVLGIEPTTDKSIIQKAYTDLIKKYHPDDQPDEFLRIQKAYKDAMNYAKLVKKEEGIIRKKRTSENTPKDIPVYTPVHIPNLTLEPKIEARVEITLQEESSPPNVIEVSVSENVPENISKKISEKIPESIPTSVPENISQNIEKTPSKVKNSFSHQKEISGLIDCIYECVCKKENSKAENSKAEKEIESLFNNTESRQIAVSTEFISKFEKSIGNISRGNLRVVQALLSNYQQVASECPANKNLAECVQYWSRNKASIIKTKIKETIKKIFVCSATACIIIACIWLIYYKNVYIFRDVPTTQQVSDILYERYGVEISPEDIKTVRINPLIPSEDSETGVSYEAVYEKDGLNIPFHSVYTLNMESPEELESNLAGAVLENYYSKYSMADYYLSRDNQILVGGIFYYEGDPENYLESPIHDSLDYGYLCELEIVNSYFGTEEYTKEEIEEFWDKFAEFIENYFSNDLIQKSGMNYTFALYMKNELQFSPGYVRLCKINVNADNYQQVLEDIEKYKKDSINVMQEKSIW